MEIAQKDLSLLLDHLRTYVQDLPSVLAHHVARAVIDSIDNWNDWLPVLHDGNRRVLPEAEVLSVVKANLPHQARRWRGILTGEKRPADLLSTTSYLNAATSLLEHYMHLGRQYLVRWWPYLVAAIAVVAGIISLILVIGNGAASVAAAIVTGLAAVGITGRTVSGALSRAAHGVEDDLLQAELDAAMGAAATVQLAGWTGPPRQATGS